jgi:PAS domain S-box-containing protein
MLQTAAVDPGTKIFWLKFVTIWQLPVVTAATCFVLQYGGLSRWLTRRTLALLALPPIVSAAFIVTDGLHHLAWSRLAVVDGTVQPTLGLSLSGALTYSYLLFVFNIGVLVWLFVRSPRHRAPVALMLLAQVAARVLFAFGVLHFGFPREWDPDPIVLGTLFGLYALALFGFHALDPVALARTAVIEQMREGLVVVDVEGRIVDANASAERALGEPLAALRGRAARDVLPVDGDLTEISRPEAREREFDVVGAAEKRHYLLRATPLKDKRGHALGHLLLLQDVTGQAKAQARVIEQERVVATLRERERLARELHDSVGQVLGYLSMQAQTARKRLQDGDDERAESLLVRLTDVAQHAHADVRESILALRTAAAEDWSLLPTLAHYLEDFHAHYGVQAELVVDDGVTEECFPPETGVQLLRVVQEAMTNARRHADACTICITIERADDAARITVSDDGCGFDTAELGSTDAGGHFGLAFMRERMKQIGGSVTIDSQPGSGTRVCFQAPMRTSTSSPASATALGKGDDR